jgi:hypothetical protein
VLAGERREPGRGRCASKLFLDKSSRCAGKSQSERPPTSSHAADAPGLVAGPELHHLVRAHHLHTVDLPARGARARGEERGVSSAASFRTTADSQGRPCACAADFSQVLPEVPPAAQASARDGSGGRAAAGEANNAADSPALAPDGVREQGGKRAGQQQRDAELLGRCAPLEAGGQAGTRHTKKRRKQVSCWSAAAAAAASRCGAVAQGRRQPDGCLIEAPCPPCSSHGASIRQPFGVARWRRDGAGGPARHPSGGRSPGISAGIAAGIAAGGAGQRGGVGRTTHRPRDAPTCSRGARGRRCPPCAWSRSRLRTRHRGEGKR